MRIIQEPKLNFEDVLLCPKRSTLTSRADVKMTRTFKFRNSQKQLEDMRSDRERVEKRDKEIIEELREPFIKRLFGG